MPIIDNKILTAMTNVQNLARKPTPDILTYQQLQAVFDAGPEALRVKLNALIDGVIADYETQSDLTTTRKLSATGDFTGTINGAPIVASDPGLQATVVSHLADVVKHITGAERAQWTAKYGIQPEIVANTDLNTIIVNGAYTIGNSASITNKPSPNADWSMLEVVGGNGGYTIQKITIVSSHLAYTRAYNGTTWTPWVSLWTQDNGDIISAQITALTTNKVELKKLNNIQCDTLCTYGEFIIENLFTGIATAAQNFGLGYPNEAGYMSLTVKPNLANGSNNGVTYIATVRDSANMWFKLQSNGNTSPWKKILTQTDYDTLCQSLSGGKKIQSGTATTANTGGPAVNAVVTFPIAFGSAPSVILTPQNSVNSSQLGTSVSTFPYSIYGISTTGFTIVSNQTGAVTYCWQAIGN